MIPLTQVHGDTLFVRRSPVLSDHIYMFNSFYLRLTKLVKWIWEIFSFMLSIICYNHDYTFDFNVYECPRPTLVGLVNKWNEEISSSLIADVLQCKSRIFFFLSNLKWILFLVESNNCKFCIHPTQLTQNLE